MRSVALDTCSPYLLEFAVPDRGRSACYLLRRATERGDTGPWSAVITARTME